MEDITKVVQHFILREFLPGEDPNELTDRTPLDHRGHSRFHQHAQARRVPRRALRYHGRSLRGRRRTSRHRRANRRPRSLRRKRPPEQALMAKSPSLAVLRAFRSASTINSDWIGDNLDANPSCLAHETRTRSPVSPPELSILGTLFWPPSFPRRRIQASKLPDLRDNHGRRRQPHARYAVGQVIGVAMSRALRPGDSRNRSRSAGSLRNSTTNW